MKLYGSLLCVLLVCTNLVAMNIEQLPTEMRQEITQALGQRSFDEAIDALIQLKRTSKQFHDMLNNEGFLKNVVHDFGSKFTKEPYQVLVLIGTPKARELAKKLVNKTFANDPKKVAEIGKKHLFTAAQTGDIKEYFYAMPFIENNFISINDTLEVESFFGDTALVVAAMQGNLEIIKLLLSHENINVNAGGLWGFTALISAVRKHYIDIVKLLLKHPEIDPNVSDKAFGYTALMHAIDTNNEAIVKLLLNHPRINIYAVNNNGETALELAKAEGKMVQLLLEHQKKMKKEMSEEEPII